jgi:hypothetical protein
MTLFIKQIKHLNIFEQHETSQKLNIAAYGEIITFTGFMVITSGMFIQRASGVMETSS